MSEWAFCLRIFMIVINFLLSVEENTFFSYSLFFLCAVVFCSVPFDSDGSARRIHIVHSPLSIHLRHENNNDHQNGPE